MIHAGTPTISTSIQETPTGEEAGNVRICAPIGAGHGPIIAPRSPSAGPPQGEWRALPRLPAGAP